MIQNIYFIYNELVKWSINNPGNLVLGYIDKKGNYDSKIIVDIKKHPKLNRKYIYPQSFVQNYRNEFIGRITNYQYKSNLLTLKFDKTLFDNAQLQHYNFRY